MRLDPSLVRIVCGVLSCALPTLLASTATAQSINLSLNVFYADPGDLGSGGAWSVVGKSSHSGIASLSLRLTGIDAGVQFDAPRGTLGSVSVGFNILSNLPQGDHRNVILAQTTMPPGEQQRIFYGVGTIPNGMPGTIGPSFPGSLTTQNVPWAPNPPGDVFGDAAWNNAATFASGTFDEGLMPEFFVGTTGQVFTTLGTSTTYGNIEPAAITAIVRTNVEGLPGDFNEDGKVDAADYIIWRINNGTSNTLPNDGGLGVPIDTAHYNLWRDNFGSMAGSGAGAGGHSSSASAVPEPAASVLAALGAAVFAAFQTRRRARLIHPAANIRHPASK